METVQSYLTIPSSHSLPPRIFGCTVYFHGPKRMKNKLKLMDIKCVFVGYGRNQKWYRCFDPLAKKMYATMDCDFMDIEFYYSHLQCQEGEAEWRSQMVDKSMGVWPRPHKASRRCHWIVHSSCANYISCAPISSVWSLGESGNERRSSGY